MKTKEPPSTERYARWCGRTVEGIVDEDVDRCIRNLTRIGSQAMNETDKVVLDIMTHKGC